MDMTPTAVNSNTFQPPGREPDSRAAVMIERDRLTAATRSDMSRAELNLQRRRSLTPGAPPEGAVDRAGRSRSGHRERATTIRAHVSALLIRSSGTGDYYSGGSWAVTGS